MDLLSTALLLASETAEDIATRNILIFCGFCFAVILGIPAFIWLCNRLDELEERFDARSSRRAKSRKG